MDCDFLIIGGGIAGVSAAARLSELGQVILLEAEDHLAHHASGRSAALYEPRYGNAAVVALSLASEEDLRRRDVLSPRGLLMVAGPDDPHFEAEAKAMEMTPVSAAEACAMVPILRAGAIARAAHADHAWDIDTDRLVQGFAREARGRGARILTGARVKALTRGAEGWLAETGREALTGRIVVNAAGAWVDEVARMAGARPLGFTPMRRSMARIPAPAGHAVGGWPMVFGAGETWYMKPDAGALIVSPAEEHPMEPHDAWADDMVLAEGLARYEDFVTEPVTRLLASWAGLRTFAPDRAPVIGPDPQVPGFFWLAGQGGYGFQSCGAASRLAADLIGGRSGGTDADLVAALSPARFG
ncbi:MAG: FAD-binding oxidoreductase [Rhodobacteraceae bacterium]|nr:FAD-binding oxidoreductase [Paracoccaceae bacterium]